MQLKSFLIGLGNIYWPEVEGFRDHDFVLQIYLKYVYEHCAACEAVCGVNGSVQTLLAVCVVMHLWSLNNTLPCTACSSHNVIQFHYYLLCEEHVRFSFSLFQVELSLLA